MITNAMSQMIENLLKDFVQNLPADVQQKLGKGLQTVANVEARLTGIEQKLDALLIHSIQPTAQWLSRATGQDDRSS